MECVIFGAAEISDYRFAEALSRDRAVTVLCADGGLVHARALGLTPSYLIGDFDSLPYGGEYSGIETIRHPIEKDDTDTALCVKKAMELGARKIWLLGCTGGRLDHTLANIQLLHGCMLAGIDARLVDESTQIFITHDEVAFYPGIVECAANTEYPEFSVFAYTERAEGVTIEGGKYPLRDAVLTNSVPLGVSNKFCTSSATVSVKRGELLIVAGHNLV